MNSIDTLNSFNAVISDHIQSIDGLSIERERPTGLIVDFEDIDQLQQLYESLPWSIQRGMGIGAILRGLGIDTTHPQEPPLGVQAIPSVTSQLNHDNPRSELSRELSEEEIQTIECSIEEACLAEDYELMGRNFQGEFTIKTDYPIKFLSHLFEEGVEVIVKYISHVEDNKYVFCFERSYDEHPMINRIKTTVSRGDIECPSCQRHVKSKSIRPNGTITLPCTHCWSTVRLTTEEVHKLREDLPADASREDIFKTISGLSKEILASKDPISSHSGLKEIGKTDELHLFDNVGEYNEADGAEFWIDIVDGPILLYSVEDLEFINSAELDVSTSCQLCDRGVQTDKRVNGLHYIREQEFKTHRFDLCRECESRVLNGVKNILLESGESSTYMSQMI